MGDYSHLFTCSRRSRYPPHLHVHNYIRFPQPARWVRVASIPMPAVDRPWGRIPSLPAGFSGGGIFYTSATPQHGIAPTRDCRFTAGTKKLAHHALRIIKTVRRGLFPPRLFGIALLPGQPENTDNRSAAPAGAAKWFAFTAYGNAAVVNMPAAGMGILEGRV